jgi:hypothetical protein
LINDTPISSGTIQGACDQVEYIEFDYDFEVADDSNSQKLQIRLENKEDSDVVKDNYETPDFKIIKDMLLNIISVEIDGIELGNLIWSHSRFSLDRPIVLNNEVKKELLKCTNLGMNGTYILEFSVPFYIWLLENL